MAFKIALSGKVEPKWFTILPSDGKHADLEFLVNPPTTTQFSVLATMKQEGDDVVIDVVAKTIDLACGIVSEWKGATDGNGEKIPCTPDAIRTVMNMQHVFHAFTDVVLPYLNELMVGDKKAKNASTTSPSGTSPKAEGKTIAPDASGRSDAPGAPTESTPPKGELL